MEIWWIMLFMVLIVPVLMILSGKLMQNKFSVSSDHSKGFRSELACRNHETWGFANRYCGRLCFNYGIVLLAVSLAGHLLVYSRSVSAQLITDIAMILGQTVFFINAVLATQDALKKKFPDDDE